MSWLLAPKLALLRLFARGPWSRLPLPEVRERFPTPEQIDLYMQVCFEYVTDLEHHGIEEHWQDPFTTHELKRGDCEDYALYAWHVLRRSGYEVHVLAVFAGEEGHAVCVFREQATYHTVCNEGLKRLTLRPRGKKRAHRLRHLAELVSESIYPGRWTCCSYVTRLSVLDAEGHARGAAGFLPHYDWIVAPGRGEEPTFTGRRQTGRR